MKHLIISREYPPASYPAGGIGTYVANIARLMVERGETVHVICERWEGAPLCRETSYEERLVVHRIAANDFLEPYWSNVRYRGAQELCGFRRTTFPNQWFAWHAGFLAEWLADHENIDVIEGQEWEAPLYYLLLRRELGLGSKQCPPVIVHLHSTTEIIFHFSEAPWTPPAYMPTKRMEEFCIRTADALLCPSHYFARQCTEFYNLPPERIRVIRLPVGLMDFVDRDAEVWSTGNICFVGRLERRKGIVEWIKAATCVAQEDARVQFDIVGADVEALERTLVRSIPRRMRSRFRFHGPKSRAELADILAAARTAVVPSRWENFPNVCIEAMSSGLPVISTRLGGMLELVEDGRTGWLTPDSGASGMVDGLADALRRCLRASPHERASMGRAAADSVRRICGNERIVNEQIEFRAEVGRRGGRSFFGTSSQQSRPGLDKMAISGQAQSGAGVIVRVRDLSEAETTLASIWSQSLPPRAVAVVHQLPSRGARESVGERVMLLHCPNLTEPDAWNAGLTALRKTARCSFWIFLDKYDSLLPHYLSEVERVFCIRADVGIITVWTQRPGQLSLEAPLCPELKYQLRGNQVTSASAFRAAAFEDTLPFCPGERAKNAINNLANAVMAKGWAGVAYPEILAQRRVEYPRISLGSFRAKLLNRFAEAIIRDRRGLMGIQDFDPDTPENRPLPELLWSCAGICVSQPRRVFCAIARKSAGVLLAIWLKKVVAAN